MSHRINVVFPDKHMQTLRDLAKERGVSYAEVLRDAVALEKWFDDARKEGSRVLVERDGDLREVIPR